MDSGVFCIERACVQESSGSSICCHRVRGTKLVKDNGGSDNFFALLKTKANHSDEGKLGKMLLRST